MKVDLGLIKIQYGEKSSEYKFNERISYCEEQISKTGELRLYKICRNEVLKIVFRYDSASDTVCGKAKFYYDKDDDAQPRKLKTYDFNLKLEQFVDNTLYDLLLDKWITEEEFDNGRR